MKGIVLVSLLLVGVVYSVSEPDMHTLYKKYLKTYEKEYTPTESATRFPLFKASYNKVQAHNTKADAGKYSFRLGMNKFADWTPAEFRARLNAKKPKTSTALFTLKANSSLSTSDSLDWRTLNVVTEVKDQGTCGACWAFASIGAMEGAHAYATSTLVSLSEQEMIDCANDGADTCTVGGEIDDGYQYAISAGGVEKESVYPYLDTSGNTCAFSTANVVATFSSYVDVDTTEAALLTAISTRPTVAVGINAGLDSFMLYESGVYSDSDCSSDEADLDHGVLLVGYGTDSTTGYDYWIIKNSWGSDWGDGGYMKLHRNYNNMCGIADDASYPIV